MCVDVRVRAHEGVDHERRHASAVAQLSEVAHMQRSERAGEYADSRGNPSVPSHMVSDNVIVCACVYARVCVCVCVCVGGRGGGCTPSDICVESPYTYTIQPAAELVSQASNAACSNDEFLTVSTAEEELHVSMTRLANISRHFSHSIEDDASTRQVPQVQDTQNSLCDRLVDVDEVAVLCDIYPNSQIYP